MRKLILAVVIVGLFASPSLAANKAERVRAILGNLKDRNAEPAGPGYSRRVGNAFVRSYGSLWKNTLARGIPNATPPVPPLVVDPSQNNPLVIGTLEGTVEGEVFTQTTPQVLSKMRNALVLNWLRRHIKNVRESSLNTTPPVISAEDVGKTLKEVAAENRAANTAEDETELGTDEDDD